MDADSDARFVYTHTPALQNADPAQSVIYCHQNPKAPYFAARDAGQSIDVDKVRQVIDDKRSRYSPLLVEAAGGLLVPIAEDLLVIDMIKQIRCRPLLVAGQGWVQLITLCSVSMPCSAERSSHWVLSSWMGRRYRLILDSWRRIFPPWRCSQALM